MQEVPKKHVQRVRIEAEDENDKANKIHFEGDFNMLKEHLG